MLLENRIFCLFLRRPRFEDIAVKSRIRPCTVLLAIQNSPYEFVLHLIIEVVIDISVGVALDSIVEGLEVRVLSPGFFLGR